MSTRHRARHNNMLSIFHDCRCDRSFSVGQITQCHCNHSICCVRWYATQLQPVRSRSVPGKVQRLPPGEAPAIGACPMLRLRLSSRRQAGWGVAVERQPHPQQAHRLPVDPKRHPVWHEPVPASCHRSVTPTGNGTRHLSSSTPLCYSLAEALALAAVSFHPITAALRPPTAWPQTSCASALSFLHHTSGRLPQ